MLIASRSSLIEYQKIDQIFSEPLPDASQRDLIRTYTFENPSTAQDESPTKRRNKKKSSGAPGKDESRNKRENDAENLTIVVHAKEASPNKGRNNKDLITAPPSKDESKNKQPTTITSDNIANLASPSYQDYQTMIADDHSLNQRIFPREDVCQYFGLRNPVNEHRDKVKGDQPACRPMVKSDEHCKETIRYYGKPGAIVSTKCEGNKYEPVCTIKQYNPNESKEANKIHVTCNMRQCKNNSVFVGFLNEDTGLLGEEDWNPVLNNNHLRQNILHHMQISQFGRSYALIKCYNLQSDKDIKQILFLPRILQAKGRKAYTKNTQISINVIVEDSLSRNQFFRSLPKTKATLRNILHSSSIKATVLDFEMMQAFSSYTWHNMMRFFAAGENNEKTYGQEVLYKLFKNAGYATFYQEETCWFDKWGIMLHKDLVTSVNGGKKEMLKKWIKHREVLNEMNFTNLIDDFGLTYYTCSVFKEMNVSNMYRQPTICYNGEYISSLYFRYLRNYITYVLENLSSTTPFFAFTHMLTSHENSGKRIASDDEDLKELLNQAAKQHNTLTILLSDHGGKGTPFSIETNQGRNEVFQPLMFMIVPDNVAKILGKNVMDALVVNQKRLLTIQDLHFALQSLVVNDDRNKGLFTPIPLARTCNDIQFKDHEALCRCDAWLKAVSNTSIATLWAAEVALGYINNMIQDQYINTNSSHNTTSRCQRYSGKRVQRARASTTSTHDVISFALVVKPLFMDVEEIFEIDVTYPVGWIGGSHVTNLVRVSRYDRYTHCVEPAVRATICTCSTNAKYHSNSDVIRKAQHESGFTTKSERKMLDEPCLGIIRRSRQRLILNMTWQDALVTFEGFNNCSHVAYKLFVEWEDQFMSRSSTPVPFYVVLLPNTLTHLATVRTMWKSGFFIQRIDFQKIKL